MAENFTPGETVSLSAQTSGASITFSLAQSASYPDCMIANAGNFVAFVGFGAPANLPGAGIANATPVLAGETLVLRKGVGVAQCSAITASGSTTLYFTAGQGS